MSVYLHDIPLTQAWDLFRQTLAGAGLWQRLGEESVVLTPLVAGRVLAAPVWAAISAPHYHAAAMDGFALQARHTDGASPSVPVILAVAGEATYVDTGDPLPDWANAVVPIEAVEPLDPAGRPASDPRSPAAIRLRAALPPWQHVRPLGEDMVATELVLPAGHTLRPVDLGAIAASGHERVVVARRPRVAVIPTGSELKPIGSALRPGDILETNSLVLAAQVEGWGGQATQWAIVPDEASAIRAAALAAAAEHDLVLINAGSSAGAEDYTAAVVKSLGRLLVHGVAVRPGHPVILGLVEQPSLTPVIGVPGYPVSAAMTGEIFVRPLLDHWLGRQPTPPVTLSATLTRKLVSPAGDDDYVRVAVGRVGERTLAAPLSRGAGVISSLVRADGLVVVPRGSQGLPAGAPVTVQLLRPAAAIDQTILAIGSHDMTLDLLAQFLAARDRRLASANAGSLGGLIALRRGEAHLAGSHLLDPASGEYNLAYLPRYLPEVAVRLVALVGRQQGLIVAAGNPRQIQGLTDLARPGVRFVNRQRGAGTRVLLDYHLDQEGLSRNQIQGYEQEEYTHLAVAAAVAAGRADCGLGIAAAAEALGLDFLPLFQERYDLVVPRALAESELLGPLWEVLQDPAFRAAVSERPGYDTTMMGQVVAETGI